MIKADKLNNIKIEIIKTTKKKDKNILGKEYFLKLYSNIWICAKKESGKTTIIYNIAKNCANRNTKIIIICPMVEKDEIYIKMIEYLKKKKINVFSHNSLYDKGDNILKDLILLLQKEKRPTKFKKIKKKSPSYIIILDDLGKELRNKYIEEILKINRHLSVKVIISSQYIHDIQPASMKQLDYALLFKSLSKEKIKLICENLDLCITKENLNKLYEYATNKPYSFLYIDARCEKFRQNFNKLLTIV